MRRKQVFLSLKVDIFWTKRRCRKRFFLVGTTIGERLLYPLTVGWAFVVAALGAQGRGKALAVALLAFRQT